MMGGLFDEHFPLEQAPEQSASEVVDRLDSQSAGAEQVQERAAEDEAEESDGRSATSKGVRSSSVSAPEAEPAQPEPQRQAPPSEPAPAPSSGSGQVRTVHSTAYCLTGTMASGRRTYYGAAAMNAVPLGARYRVLSGPAAGRTLTVEDRIGSGSQFDIAYPGDCAAARQYGRRTIEIEKV